MEKASSLIFAWKDRYHWRLRLLFFLIVSVALHVFCFYLFRVTYPQTERRLPYTAKITVLNPKDTLTQTVLRQIDDRIVSIDSARRQVIAGTSIETYAPVFKPFFKDYEIQLKTPPPIFPLTAVPDLVPAGSAILPPVSAHKPMTDEITQAPPFTLMPHLTIRGDGLEERDLVRAIDWSTDLDKFKETNNINGASFMIAVDQQGTVRNCLPTEGEESGVLELLTSKVTSLRFQPSDTALQWGWVDLKW